MLLTDLWHIDDAFDVITISAEEKVMKPDARIFHTALERLGVQAVEAIFLDDFKVNVDAANALGLIGVHFRSSEQAQRDIRALLDGKRVNVGFAFEVKSVGLTHGDDWDRSRYACRSDWRGCRRTWRRRCVASI
ncbi:MAG: HAD-IA family hydrolase [Anaerolineae bacterium]